MVTSKRVDCLQNANFFIVKVPNDLFYFFIIVRLKYQITCRVVIVVVVSFQI